jgi:hypothetical protein
VVFGSCVKLGRLMDWRVLYMFPPRLYICGLDVEVLDPTGVTIHRCITESCHTRVTGCGSSVLRTRS